MAIRNRKTVIVIFLILVAMLVGIGYAEITGSLSIEGTVTSSAQKFNVVFTGAKAVEIHDNADDNAVPALSVQNTKMVKSDTITIDNLFAVSMTVSGLATTEDYVTVTFTIKNHNKVPMKLTPSVTGNSVFAVDEGFEDGDDAGTELDETKIIAAEGETTYTVTVRLANDGYDASKTETFTITISGTSITE